MMNKYKQRTAEVLDALASLTEGVKERMSKLSTKGIKPKKWYEEDTEIQLASVEPEVIPFLFGHFGFALSQTGSNVQMCRETFCSSMGGRFRKGKGVWFYLDIIGRKSKHLARMRRKMHIMEQALGYRPHEMKCVRHYVRPKTTKQPEVRGARWLVRASPTWRRSIPMFSFFLGSLRGYCRSGTYDPTNELMFRILDKNKVSGLFGANLEKNWTGSGVYGAKYFERKVKSDSKLRKKLKV